MTYTIGEVEEISGVKANVLRYWETVIPGFAPHKDLGGWRIYTERELDIILRLKHLIYERKFTIEGARNEILHEAEKYESKSDLLQEIQALRTELANLYLMIRKQKK